MVGSGWTGQVREGIEEKIKICSEDQVDSVTVLQ